MAFVAWPLMIIEGVAAGLSAIGVATNDIKKYMLAIIPDGNSERLLLIKRNYQPELDTIITLDHYKFTPKDKCPNCSSKIKSVKKLVKKEDLLYTCPKCSKKIIICI